MTDRSWHVRARRTIARVGVYYVFALSLMMFIASIRSPQIIRLGPAGGDAGPLREHLHQMIMGLVVLGSGYGVLHAIRRNVRARRLFRTRQGQNAKKLSKEEGSGV